MLRRLTACLLALLLLAAVPARAAEVADLAILSQWDERFYDQAYRYNNNHFRFGGCGPAAAANALIAALDVTDQDLAAGIFHDVLYLLTNNRPAKSKFQVAKLSYLQFTDSSLIADERYPSLSQAMRDFNGVIRYENNNVSAAFLESALDSIRGRKALYHGTLASSNRWTNLCEMASLLMHSGYEDAVMVVGLLGAGTSGTQGPFRSGTAGHYLCLYLPVKEFCETGVFYVLDSLPRALEGEYYAPNEPPYMVKYDFVGQQKYTTSLAKFNELFQVERLQTTILRVSPLGDALQAVNDAAGKNALASDELLPYLEQVVVFYGTAHVLFSLPER